MKTITAVLKRWGTAILRLGLEDTYSTEVDRLVYEVFDNRVEFLQARYHY